MSLDVFDPCLSDTRLIVSLGLLIPVADTALWDVSVWDGTATWSTAPDPTDVSAYVRSITTNRRFSSDLRAWEAGSATVVLDNRDGRFSPDNLDLAAPYVVAGMSGMRPGCPLNISIYHEGVVYSIFSGSITDLVEQWPGHQISRNNCSGDPYDDPYDPENVIRDGDALIEITATDAFGILGRIKKRVPVTPIGSGDSFGTRTARILDSVGYAPRNIEPGVSTLQETDLASDVISELTKVAESEGGWIWPDADGTIIARGRYTPLDSPRSNVVQVEFGDNISTTPPEVRWSGIAVAPVSDKNIVNHAIYSRVGGSAQEYSDPYSIALYGICDDSSGSTDLLNEDDSQVLSLAQWRVVVGTYPESAIESVEVKPRCDIAVLAPLVLERMIFDLVSIKLRPPSAQMHYLYRKCLITGVAHIVENNDWTVKFFLASATAYTKFNESRWDLGLWGSSDIDPNGAIWFV